MRLCELPAGGSARLIQAPESLSTLGFIPGKNLHLFLSRPGLLTVDLDGARFALSPDLAAEVLIRTLPS